MVQVLFEKPHPEVENSKNDTRIKQTEMNKFVKQKQIAR